MNSIAMFMSNDRLREEHGMLNRLGVGLLNDGVQVTRVIPQYCGDIPPDYERSVSIIPKFHTQFTAPLFQRKELQDKLCAALTKQKTTSIACFGKVASTLGASIAPLLDIPLYQEIISMREAKRVRMKAPVTRWLAATPTLERTIIERVGEERAAFVPLGIGSLPSQDEGSDSQTKCVVLLNASDDPKSTISVLEALVSHRELHIFLELDGKKDHKIWSAVEEAKMLERTTCLQNIAALRTLMMETDLVILPSSSMPMRTVLLEAMESGVPVLSTKIDGFDMLINGETALVNEGPWDEPLTTIIQDVDLRNRLCKAATTLVATNYGSAAQIAALQAAVIPF
jgi:glycosyltransferase involved in cell wall biosynthesis